MKFFKLDLLTLLISLFILGSCKNQTSIGLGVTSANQLSGSLIDTSTIVINTVPEDTIITNNGGPAPLGFFNDPVFGQTEANLALDLNLPSSSAYTLPSGTISIDSAILVLRFAPSGFYGDSLASRYKVNVYQLAERFYPNTNYYNTKQWKYNSSTLLGTQTFFSRTHDSLLTQAIVEGGVDTFKKAPPQLRIPIDPNFVNTNLFNASVSQQASNLVFKNAVKGLYVTIDKAKTTGNGGVFFMAPDSAAEIDVFYKLANGSTVDTTNVTLPVSGVYASQIKHTYSAAIQTELANTNTGSRNAVYLQGLAGLRAKISFPYLKNLAKSLGSNVVINRAELIVTPYPGSGIPFPPLQQLTMYQFDLAHQRTYLQDGSPADPRAQGVGTFGGFYLTNLLDYHFIVTAYVQDLLLGKTVDYGTFLGAANLNTGTTFTSATYAIASQTAARTFVVGTDKTSPYRIKLNIIYTKIPAH